MQYASPSQPSSKKAQGAEYALENAPPFNLDAEQAVLGSLLVWNDAREDIPFLGAEDFFDGLHKAIFEAIVAAVRSNRRANPVTLAKQFADTPPVGERSVPNYLAFLGTCAAPRPHLKDHARVIADLSARRTLMLIGEDLAIAARESSIDVPPSDLIEETETRLFSLAQHNTAEISTTLTFAEAAKEAAYSAEQVALGKMKGIRTGLTDLDAKLVGPNPTDLVILAGRPGMGKTALAVNIAWNVARSQCPVHFFSLEMSAEQLAMRVLGEQIEVSASKLRTGKASPIQLTALQIKIDSLGDVPLYIDQLGGASITQVAARARRLKRKHNTGLICVDYIQLMQATRRRSNGSRVEDVSEITTGLKALAKELNVPILALSQLSRNVEHRDNKRPQLPDLRESGSIEQDADIVMFVFREEYYVEREQPSATPPGPYADWMAKLDEVKGKAEIIIGKQRHGELANVSVSFSGEFTRFSNLARQTEPRNA